MKRLLVSLAAVGLLVGLAAGPVSADRSTWNNWHVHDGCPGSTTCPYTDANGLTHMGVSFGPVIFGASYATNPDLWLYCTDATMKLLLDRQASANAVLYAGNCFNTTTVLHLRLNPGNPAPDGWTPLVWPPGGDVTFYYMLTSR